jgi:S1-C subfamily serine protease
VVSNPTASIVVLSAIDPVFDLQHNQVTNANFEASHAKVVAEDEVNDIAILQTNNKPRTSTGAIVSGDHDLTAHFAVSTLNANLPEAGARVLLAGFPLGQPYLIVQPGTVAAIAHNLPGWPNTTKILVSTVANHGASGAP